MALPRRIISNSEPDTIGSLHHGGAGYPYQNAVSMGSFLGAITVRLFIDVGPGYY